MLEIFPYFLARVASQPIDEFIGMGNAQMLEALEMLYKLNTRVDIQRDKVCEAIFNVFKQVENPDHQTALVTVKRNIFNRRDNSSQDLVIVEQYLSDAANHDLNEYLRLLEHYQTKATDTHQLFEQTLEDNRLLFKQLIPRDSVYNGLLIAAPSLLNQTGNYLKKTSEAFRKKELQTELSLLKYLTRMYTKTTPFGTFTNIGLAQPKWLKKGETPKLQFLSGVSSEVQINNYLFLWLEKELLQIKDIYFHLQLFVNHTLHVKANQYLFYTNQDNYEETFHKVEINGLLEYIVDLINDSENVWSLHSLINLLIEETEATTEELAAYLQSLIKVGLLEMTLIPSKKTPNQALELAQALDKQIAHKTPFVKEVIAQVNALHHAKEAYLLAQFKDRKTLLKEANTIIENLFEMVAQHHLNNPRHEGNNGPNLQAISQANLFYEDTFKTTQLHVDKVEFNDLLDKVNKLASQCLHARLRFFSLIDASSLFQTMYALDAEVDFLEFFEYYYIQVVQKKREELDQNPTFVQLTKKYKERWKKLTKAWVTTLAEGIAPYTEALPEVVHLDSGIFDKVSKKDMPRIRENRYYASFLQLHQDHKNAPISAFIHSITVGYSKMYSRFLNIKEHQKTLDEARLWNAQLMQTNELFIENQDESFANSNIHPTLIPYQVQLKNTQKIPEGTQPVALDELKIRFNQRSEEIELVHHQSGKFCRVFDLDFQTIEGRSEMFKFLSIFDISEAPLYFDILEKVNQPYIHKDKTYTLPRVVFESQVILQRKTWVIPQKFLPQKYPNTSSSQYFLEVNQWRQAQGIPHQVFARLNQNDLPKTTSQPSKDLFKPQFIDFNNPLIFRIFEKLIKKITSSLIIEEALPAPKGHVPNNDQTFASEFVVQWVDKVKPTQ